MTTMPKLLTLATLNRQTFQSVVSDLRRRSDADLKALERGRRFLSPMIQDALLVVRRERQHRMGGN